MVAGFAVSVEVAHKVMVLVPQDVLKNSIAVLVLFKHIIACSGLHLRMEDNGFFERVELFQNVGVSEVFGVRGVLQFVERGIIVEIE